MRLDGDTELTGRTTIDSSSEVSGSRATIEKVWTGRCGTGRVSCALVIVMNQILANASTRLLLICIIIKKWGKSLCRVRNEC